MTTMLFVFECKIIYNILLTKVFLAIMYEIRNGMYEIASDIPFGKLFVLRKILILAAIAK